MLDMTRNRNYDDMGSTVDTIYAVDVVTTAGTYGADTTTTPNFDGTVDDRRPYSADTSTTFSGDNLPTTTSSAGFGSGSAAGESISATPTQDILVLHLLCENAHGSNDESWEEIREWFRSHPEADAKEAAERRGDCDTTALHLACRNAPPPDIMEILLSTAPGTVAWVDSFGWLPLHYACANGASEDVLRILIDRYPEAQVATDNRGRTPLHFLLGNTEKAATASAVALLASSGAAMVADENRMLPLHYACAYGASEGALHALTDGNPDSITATDRKGRTPLHFALGNADRPASPAVVRLLLSQNREVVNSIDRDGGQLPLHLLAIRAHTLRPEQRFERENAQKCLELYLNAEPRATAEFLTALQALPDWLSERAVVTPVVQSLLNEKISQRFPTAVLMLDFYFLWAVIITYSITVQESLKRRFNSDQDDDAIPVTWLISLYIGAAYFLIREVLQMLSLLSLGLFRTWLHDPTNWLDVAFIFLSLYWAVVMNTGSGDAERFRTGTALSLFVLWTNVLSFLKSMLIDFAVFVGGVFYVVRRLTAFLVALMVILIAFSQMFVTVFQQTNYCNSQNELNYYQDVSEVSSGYEVAGVDRPFCKFWTSFLKVYTMLLGEVDETAFADSKLAEFFFACFMFLVVILLANVLIAIVTDSYGVIRNERAAIVFWSNRLDFVAEMDIISSGPWKKKVKNTLLLGGDDVENANFDNQGQSPFGRELWKKLFELLEDNPDDVGVLSIDFWIYNILRMFTALVIIPAWLGLGLLSAGWLWPPQVREGLLTQRISKHNPGDMKEAEQRTLQVKALREEVKNLQDEVVMEMEADRQEVLFMKSQIVQMKSDFVDEMNHIKQIMTRLFELQSQMDPDEL